jgi:hypothetical protein
MGRIKLIFILNLVICLTIYYKDANMDDQVLTGQANQLIKVKLIK